MRRFSRYSERERRKEIEEKENGRETQLVERLTIEDVSTVSTRNGDSDSLTVSMESEQENSMNRHETPSDDRD